MRLWELMGGLREWFLAEMDAPPGLVPRVCFTGPDDTTKTLPLEWNQAKRFADITGVPVWMEDSSGFRTLGYTPSGDAA